MSRENLIRLTYSEAEQRHRSGYITLDVWAWYRHLWRNLAFRWSYLAEDLEHTDEAAREACTVCLEGRELLVAATNRRQQ